MAQGSRSQKITVRGFDGGLNNVNDITTINDGELAVLDNLEIDSNGALVSRPPFSINREAIVAGQAMTIVGYYSYGTSLPNLVIAMADGTYLYEPTADDYTKITSIVASGCAQWGDRLYICSKTTSGGYWDASTSTFTVLGTGNYRMPKGEQIILHKSRFFLVSAENGHAGSRVYFSRVTSAGPVVTSINEWNVWLADGNDYFDVSPGDGQTITKLLAGTDEVFIFRTRSTYYFKYDVSPLDSGVLQLIDSAIGADNADSVVQYEFSYIVLNNGRIYRFVSYQYYPLNDPNRLELRPTAGVQSLTIKSALSILGRRALVWYGGVMYVLDLDSGLWCTWSSAYKVAYVKTIPRVAGDLSSDTAYGVTGSGTSSLFRIYKITDTIGPTGGEEMTCTVQTKAFDFDQPDTWKRMFYWSADVYTARDVIGKATPIALSTFVATWDDMSAKTWDELADGTWDSILEKSPTVLTTLDYPGQGPYRVNVTFQKDMRFRRCSFEIIMTTDGTNATGPVRMTGLTIHASPRKGLPEIIQ